MKAGHWRSVPSPVSVMHLTETCSNCNRTIGHFTVMVEVRLTVTLF